MQSKLESYSDNILYQEEEFTISIYVLNIWNLGFIIYIFLIIIKDMKIFYCDLTYDIKILNFKNDYNHSIIHWENINIIRIIYYLYIITTWIYHFTR